MTLGNQINESFCNRRKKINQKQKQKQTKQSFKNKNTKPLLVSRPYLLVVGLLQIDSRWARKKFFFLQLV
jgi:hypothetical protein